jgi:hypothetical protein
MIEPLQHPSLIPDITQQKQPQQHPQPSKASTNETIISKAIADDSFSYDDDCDYSYEAEEDETQDTVSMSSIATTDFTFSQLQQQQQQPSNIDSVKQGLKSSSPSPSSSIKQKINRLSNSSSCSSINSHKIVNSSHQNFSLHVSNQESKLLQPLPNHEEKIIEDQLIAEPKHDVASRHIELKKVDESTENKHVIHPAQSPKQPTTPENSGEPVQAKMVEKSPEIKLEESAQPASASSQAKVPTFTESMLQHQNTDFYREQITAMREKKRRMKALEEDERVLVGNKVSEGHVNYAAAYYMLTGIRVSVSRCNAKVDRELTDEDFTARHKLAFDISGNELIPSSKYDFKFKDYSPWVFRHLRELFKLDPADYLMSLTSKYIVSELSSPGKSGSFFYFSRDYRFIIKTIHHSEHKMLRKILKDYYYHVKNNPNTLISQFYGLHRVKLPFGKKIHFIVMNNLFPPHHDLHRTYDLKGSSLGREFVPKHFSSSSHVLKDINWLKNHESLKLGPIKAKKFIEQLEKDVTLLKRLNIMDYSLLIGIHDKKVGDSKRQSLYMFEPNTSGMNASALRKAVNSTSPTEVNTVDLLADTFGQRDLYFYNDDGGFQATGANNEPLTEIYYLGVIDCLTPYTFYKRVETFWKGLSHTRSTISAIPAVEYGDRFFHFMKRIIKKESGQDNDNYDHNVAGDASRQPLMSNIE